jgi:acyl-CoA dehydrogenase
MVLKHHQNQGNPPGDLPIVEWASRELLYEAQEQLHSVLRNFPNRPLAWLMRLLIFPRGLTYFAPADRLGRRVAELVTNNTESRNRLAHFVYRTDTPGNPMAALQQALEMADAAEPIERKLRVEGQKTGRLTALDLAQQIEQARALGILSEDEANLLADYDRRVMQIVNVDDFDPRELPAHPL